MRLLGGLVAAVGTGFVGASLIAILVLGRGDSNGPYPPFEMVLTETDYAGGTVTVRLLWRDRWNWSRELIESDNFPEYVGSVTSWHDRITTTDSALSDVNESQAASSDGSHIPGRWLVPRNYERDYVEVASTNPGERVFMLTAKSSAGRVYDTIVVIHLASGIPIRFEERTDGVTEYLVEAQALQLRPVQPLRLPLGVLNPPPGPVQATATAGQIHDSAND